MQVVQLGTNHNMRQIWNPKVLAYIIVTAFQVIRVRTMGREVAAVSATEYLCARTHTKRSPSHPGPPWDKKQQWQEQLVSSCRLPGLLVESWQARLQMMIT